MARIEQAVSQAAAEQADSELRSQVYAEIEALLAEALRVENSENLTSQAIIVMRSWPTFTIMIGQSNIP